MQPGPDDYQGYINGSAEESTSGMFHPVAGGQQQKSLPTKIYVQLCEYVKTVQL